MGSRVAGRAVLLLSLCVPLGLLSPGLLPAEVSFIRSDTNQDSFIDLSDAILVLLQLFVEDSGLHDECPRSADTNGDDAVDVTDAIYLLSFLFRGGPPPPPPYPDCGAAPGGSDLACVEFEPCGLAPTSLWESLGGPPGAGRCLLIQNEVGTHRLYVSTPRGVYESGDKGGTWQPIEPLQGGEVSDMAASGQQLFVCRESGLVLYDGSSSLTTLFSGGWSQVEITGGRLCAASGAATPEDLRILMADPDQGAPQWRDISPSPSELSDLVLPPPGSGFESGIQVSDILVSGETILAGILVATGGDHQQDNGRLYRSADRGDTWGPVTLGAAAEGFVVARLVEDPTNASRVLALLRDPVDDRFHPIASLVWESPDLGVTWAPATTLSHQVGGITDAHIVGSSIYLVGPSSPEIIRLDGEALTRIDTPGIPGFEGIAFQLESILFDPDTPGTVYGQTGRMWQLGLVKSTDGMATWTKMDADIVASSPTIVLAHPEDTETVFATGNVIQESYLTRDGGATWQPFSPTYSDDEVRIDPHDSDHIYLINEQTLLWESFDGGDTFSPVESEFTSAKVFDFEIAEGESPTLYASNLGTGLSRLGGDREWSYMLRSPDYCYDLAIDPEDGETLYAANSPKKFEDFSTIWKYSPDTAADPGWHQLWKFANTAGVTSLEIDREDPNRMYAGVVGERGRIYSTDDRGVTWEPLGGGFTFVTIHELAVDPGDDATVYAAPWGGGLFRSTDHGETWMELDSPTVSISSIVIDPEDSSHVLLGDRTAPRIYESSDRCRSWHPLVELDQDLYYRVFAMALHAGELYFSVMNRQEGLLSLFTGPFSGTSFRLGSEGPAPLEGEMTRVALDFHSNGHDLYAVSHIQGVFQLLDGRWVDLSEGLPAVGFNTVLTLEGSTICVAGGCALDVDLTPRESDPGAIRQIYTRRSPEEGWTQVLSGDPFGSGIKKLLCHPDDDTVWFAATGNGIFVSRASGAAGSWSPQNSGLLLENIGDMALTRRHVYAGTLGGGVYVGRILPDYSVAWESSTGPFPPIYNVQVRIDPADSDVLYASSYPGGVFKTTDGGSTWHECNFGLPSFPVDDPTLQGYYSLEIDPADTEVLYLGISGKGVYKSTTGGATWRPMYGALVQNREIMRSAITRIRVDPADSDQVYLATREGVYHSTDGAESWTPLNSGLQTLDVVSLRLVAAEEGPYEEDFEGEPPTDCELEAGWEVVEDTEGHVLRGSGHFWARCGNPLWSDYTLRARIRILAGAVHVNVRVSDDGRYFVGLHEGGVYLTKQFHGWSEFADLDRDFSPVAIGVWHTLEIEVEGNRITIRLDGAERIEFVDEEPQTAGAFAFETLDDSTVYVDDILVTPAGGSSRLYAGTAGYGIYTYDRAAGRWRHLGRTLGVGWWEVWERRMYQFSSLLFDAEQPGKLYLGHFPGGFFISEDNGRSWRDSSLGLGNDGIFSLAQHPHEPHVLFAGTYNGVWRSSDGGRTWQSRSEGMPPEQWPYTIAIDPEDPQTLYVSTKNGQNKGFCERNEFCGVVMKSVNGGEQWTEVMDGLDRRSEFYTLLVYPRDPAALFLSTSRGMYWSRNRGSLWEPLNEGLPITHNAVRDNVAQNLTFTSDHRYLLLGLTGHGVWRADLSKLPLAR